MDGFDWKPACLETRLSKCSLHPAEPQPELPAGGATTDHEVSRSKLSLMQEVGVMF